MKLYVFYSPSSGWESYMVCAPDETTARALVTAKMAELEGAVQRPIAAMNMEVFEPGVVATHWNDE